MRVVHTASPEDFDGAAADWTCEHLRGREQPVLALPTGNTPLGLYSQLVARSRAGALSLAGARIFNLDEYCGLSASDPHSYAAFLQRHLIEPMGLKADRVRLLKGDAADLQAECKDYDATLERYGGIDLCILGLGVNGHVAFNEPGSDWNLRTHVVHLTHTTRVTHEGQAKAPWKIPDQGVTMGIKTILEARHVLLLIAGSGKEAARRAVYGGKADIDWPVTSLLAHADLTVIDLCEPAARL
jgi:glucosamine-6-phosphate deaminase